VKVGIVGATTPGSMVWDRDNLRGSIVIGDIVPAVRPAAAAGARGGLRRSIVVTDAQRSGRAARRTTPSATGFPERQRRGAGRARGAGVDLIAYGHSHKEMADTTSTAVLLMQAKNWVQSVAVASVRLVREGGAWRVASKSSRLVRTAGTPNRLPCCRHRAAHARPWHG
jgi:2',3'-cyclic-nucleotide 2'-phosphodiesterase/3'-nucleotidase